jgi:glycosyltransferase involved in cell wall biosynthesis
MSEKISILYLRETKGRGGGADTIILDSIRYINKDSFSIIVVYLRKYKEVISYDISSQIRDMGCNYFELPGIKVFDLKQFFNIIKIIKQYNIKIVHCHDPKTDFYGYLLKIFFPELRFISTIHGWIERRKRSAYYIKIDIFVLKRFDAVIAVSNNIKQSAEKSGIKRTYLIQNSIDINRWRPSREKNPSRLFNIGFVGRISKEKGPIDFVFIAKKILAQDSNCEFWVAGEGPEEMAMKDLVRELELGNKFHFLGQLDYNQIHGFYKNINLLLSPSYTEGLPITILEACAMSVPVVATKVGGVNEIITHNYNGLLTDAGDIDLMARYALLIKHNNKLADMLKTNGRSIVENRFSLANNVKKIENLYIKIL